MLTLNAVGAEITDGVLSGSGRKPNISSTWGKNTAYCQNIDKISITMSQAADYELTKRYTQTFLLVSRIRLLAFKQTT